MRFVFGKFLIINLAVLIFTGCARFDFNTSSLSSLSAVTVLGITGGTDAVVDFYLFDGNVATVNWLDVNGEDSYSVYIYENDQTTLVCSQASVPADSTSYTFVGCPLSEGSSYYALVESNMPFSATSVASSLVSGFNLGPSAYEFLYPSTVTLQNTTENESVGVGNLVVTLSAPSDWPVTLTYNTTNGSAVSSGIFKDYDAVATQTLVIPAGTTTASFNVNIDDDPRDEDDQPLSFFCGDGGLIGFEFIHPFKRKTAV